MPIKRIVLYAQDVEKTVRFYEKYLDFEPSTTPDDRIVELVNLKGGVSLMVHQAAKGQRDGQSIVKLVFDVEDVAAFCDRCAERGLKFGSIHVANGYLFANAKDPCNNSISVSSRAYRQIG